jgi:hypothetical protein
MRRLSGNRQDVSLYIRMFADELESIKAAAASEGKTVSEYVRARVLSGKVENPPASSQVVKEDPLENLRAPIEKQSPAKERPVAVSRKEKIARQVETPKSKRKVCPHGFLIVAGATACTRCS